jgi:hypothetical protein
VTMSPQKKREKNVWVREKSRRWHHLFWATDESESSIRLMQQRHGYKSSSNSHQFVSLSCRQTNEMTCSIVGCLFFRRRLKSQCRSLISCWLSYYWPAVKTLCPVRKAIFDLSPTFDQIVGQNDVTSFMKNSPFQDFIYLFPKKIA